MEPREQAIEGGTPEEQQREKQADGAEGLAPPPIASEPGSLGNEGVSDSEPTTIDIELDPIPSSPAGIAEQKPDPGEAAPSSDSAIGQSGPHFSVSDNSDEEEEEEEQEGEEGDGDDSHLKRKKRRKRKVLLPETGRSAEAAMQRKELASRGDLKRIQRAGVKVHGQKVVADDVNKLKSLSVTPQLEGEFIDHYIEPVRIEYYIPKESRFVTETRYLYVPLIDPEPRTDPDDRILRDHIDAEKFVDLLQVLGDYPQFTTLILDSYHETFHMYESLSRTMKEARTDAMRYRTALYMVETLGQHEPTLAALEALGEFQSWNLNWLIRTMNEKGVEFACADYTISYLIKRRNEYWEQNDLPFDERFEILASLFYDQAFPNRGLHIGEEDYFFDIFEKKNFLG